MREKAYKLEKGKWYSDIMIGITMVPAFFRFEYRNHLTNTDYFDLMIGDGYVSDLDGKYSWHSWSNWYIATKEDIEKYNLNKTE